MSVSSQMPPAEAIDDIRRMLVEVREMLVARQPAREYYSVDQAAEALRRRPFTVREWCRLGRINAEKRKTGRGRSTEWVIAHAELARIEKEGLLPVGLKN